MGEELQIIVTFLLFLALLGSGMAVPFAIMLPAMVYLYLQGGFAALNGLGLVSWGSMDSFTLTAIPLFLLMAEFIQRSGLGFRVYAALSKLVSRVPGGLLQTNIVGCAMFAAVSGSSIATAAAIGNVALPQLMSRGYDRKLSAGSLAAGGTLGILVPPEHRDDRLRHVHRDFGGQAVHGRGHSGRHTDDYVHDLYCHPGTGAAVHRAPTRSRRAICSDLRMLLDIAPFILLISGILGTIYAGIATPTEAAAAGCLFSIVICRIFGDLSWKVFVASLRQSMLVVGNILFITYAAFVFSYAMSYGAVGEHITEFIIGLNLSRIEFFLALLMLYTVLGALVESLGMMVITVPLLYPVLAKYGIDPIWFGIIVVVFIELGQITPPIGINLFVIQSIWRGGTIGEVVAGTIPFHLIMFLLLALLLIWPNLALWLPRLMSN